MSKFNRFLKLMLVPVISGSLLYSGGVANAATPSPTETSNVVQTSGSALDNEAQAVELLKIIDQIPEEVLMRGDAATRSWVELNLEPGVPGPGEIVPTASFWKCSGAILVTIGTTVFPAAKLLKIKRYMKALGGTTEAIKILWGASFSYEKLQAIGGTAAALGAELLGIAAIREACTDR